VKVEVLRYDGMLHGFLACAGVIGRAAGGLGEIGGAVRSSLQRLSEV